MFDLKFTPVLKMAIYSMLRETYLHLATLDSTGISSAQMQRIWVAGIHKLANTVSLPPCHPKPITLSSLSCVIAVYGASELELKVICVIGKSTIFLLCVWRVNGFRPPKFWNFPFEDRGGQRSLPPQYCYREIHNYITLWDAASPQFVSVVTEVLLVSNYKVNSV